MIIECANRGCKNSVTGPTDRFCPTCLDRLPATLRQDLEKAKKTSPQAELTLVNTAKQHLQAS